MKTWPIWREDGSMLAFEVTSCWITFRPLYRILRSVPGITDVKRQWFNEDHVRFTYRGVSWVVYEPWGDSSRYWIGPEHPGNQSPDVSEIEAAFREHRSLLSRFLGLLWPRSPRMDL